MFEKARFEYEVVRDKDKEAEEIDEEWGYGGLEEAEREGRRVNGEYELAVRGMEEMGDLAVLFDFFLFFLTRKRGDDGL